MCHHIVGAGPAGVIAAEALRGFDREADVVLVGGALIKCWCESKGVTVRTGTQVAGVEAAGSGLRLECEGGETIEADRVVGALAMGLTKHVGVVRGLIQIRVGLGPWRSRLLRDPTRVMAAYLDRTQGSARLADEALRA